MFLLQNILYQTFEKINCKAQKNAENATAISAFLYIGKSVLNGKNNVLYAADFLNRKIAAALNDHV